MSTEKDKTDWGIPKPLPYTFTLFKVCVVAALLQLCALNSERKYTDCVTNGEKAE